MHPDTFPANPNRDPIQQLDDSVGVQGAATPDTGINAEADIAAAKDRDAELEETTADELIAADHLPQEPDEARAEDDPQATEAPSGRYVFKPHELNQSGEDKEYFPPKKDHKFDAPTSANEHALRPDFEVTPDNKMKVIR
ncbi:MAG TPA: hypothetical protein VG839_06865 [Asticcacaulis sp.]|nr:hypothetical protein [Asticcacaulis sp.]